MVLYNGHTAHTNPETNKFKNTQLNHEERNFYMCLNNKAFLPVLGTEPHPCLTFTHIFYVWQRLAIRTITHQYSLLQQLQVIKPTLLNLPTQHKIASPCHLWASIVLK